MQHYVNTKRKNLLCKQCESIHGNISSIIYIYKRLYISVNSTQRFVYFIVKLQVDVDHETVFKCVKLLEKFIETSIAGYTVRRNVARNYVVFDFRNNIFNRRIIDNPRNRSTQAIQSMQIKMISISQGVLIDGN